MIVIDEISYDIPVLSIKRKAEFLDKYAERTEDGTLQRELIGVYFNYQIQFGRTNNVAEYASLWTKLTEVVEFHTVTVPDETGDYTFVAYFSNVGDELTKAKDAQNFWRSLTVNFIARAKAA